MAVSPDEHLVVYQPDQAGRALDLLLWQDRGRPRIEALVTALGKGAQLLENTSWAVIVGATTIDGAEGVNLDRWGNMIGEARGGLDEEAYRTFIDLRILVNTTFPSEDNLWTVMSQAVDPGVLVALHIAGGIIYQFDAGPELPLSLAAHAGALLRDYRAAGIFAALVGYVDDHFALDWETTAPVLTDGTGTARVAELIYSGWSRPRPRRGP